MTDLVARVRALDSGSRVVLGLCGPPGAGKSTLAAHLVAELGSSSVLVPLDGFHLHDDVLRAQGSLGRKGAPDTFDVRGYLALLTRLRSDDGVVYAPAFDRSLETSLAGAIPVLPSHRIVVTEGNYLLLAGAWSGVRPLLDACWFVDVDDEVRRARLVERNLRHGRSQEAAEEWVARVDGPNADLVAATRELADYVVDAG
ncbi:MAG TPA: nucleoside/nucleotide kinase family protein [Nocardioidaceae bacterium]|nr:nucleoside/nucleotide kinase family protein [Nocardioidaceae bacterium]